MPSLRLSTKLASLLALVLSLQGQAHDVDGRHAWCDREGGCAGSGDDDAPLLQLRQKSTDGQLGGDLPQSPPVPRWSSFSSRHGGLSQLQAGQLPSLASCTITEPNDCSFASLRGQDTLVYPGGESTCLSGEYAFVVLPGDKDKVLFIFGTGGLCYNVPTPGGLEVVQECVLDLQVALGVFTNLGVGVQNRTDPRNPFRRYTIVIAVYCSGDVFVGNGTFFNGTQALPQRGYYNVLATKEWTERNFPKSDCLDSFVIIGASAGALGVTAWANNLLESFTYTRAAVVMDSFAGFTPPGTAQALLLGGGTCSLPLLSSEEQTLCIEQKLILPDLMVTTIGKYRHVPFTSLQSKIDGTQIGFYNLLAQTFGLEPPGSSIDNSTFLVGANGIFERYRAAGQNYVNYQVNSDIHTYTPEAYFFTANTADPFGAVAAKGPKMYSWVASIVGWHFLFVFPIVTTQCSGPVESNNASNGDSFCDKAIYNCLLILY